MYKTIFAFVNPIRKKIIEKGNSRFFSSGNGDRSFNHLNKAAGMALPDLLSAYQSRENGLNKAEAEQRLEIFGYNEVQHKKAPPWYIQLLKAFITPFNGVLFLVAVVSLFTDIWLTSPEDRDYKTVIVVLILILLSSLIGFWQEFRSSQAADKLKSMIKTTVNVLREGKNLEINLKELAPGDIVLLSAGDMIPADCRVVQSKDLFISESMLTGESLPVEKKDKPIPDAENKPTLELENTCYMGTNVVSGSATVLALSTGDDTYFGSFSKELTGAHPETSFDKGVRSISWLLIRFMLVMVPLVFIINVWTKGNWLDAFLFAIAIAVGLTPGMLPMIVTTNLAKGALSMSRKQVIVKRLNSIQNLGAIDILCTDKTGTLTLDKIVLERHLNIDGDEDDEVLKWAYLNSHHQTGLKNILDQAVLEHVEVKRLLHVEEYEKVDEIPFDFQRRRMSVILKQKNGKHLMICKGAAEEIIDKCTYAFDPGPDHELHIENDVVVKLDEGMRERALKLTKKLNEDGLRVLMLAIREFDERELTYSVADESDMTLTGFIGFLDPAKPSARPAIAALLHSGISIKVLTGDNETVTKKVCRDVGLISESFINGSELEKLNDEELSARVNDISIFAKVSPMQKSRIVKALQAKGHTVGFLGDGINDAGALRDADVGISVDTAVDIAKESADIILLERDLFVLQRGVVYGRRTFGNIIKYIKMAASSNFGNMFSMLGASAFLPFLPMLPVQVLVQNLLYDVSQISIPWDTMDEEFVEKPKKWDARGIGTFMFYVGPISSLFDYVTFAVLFFYFRANTPHQQSFFQTGWFVEGLLSQTLIVHLIRTKKIPFVESWASPPVILLTLCIMALGIYIPYSPFAAALKMESMPWAYYPWLFAILCSYFLLMQVVKRWFIRRFGQWL